MHVYNHHKLKLNLFLYSLFYRYAEACTKFAVLISVPLPPCNTARFNDMPQLWQAVGNAICYVPFSRFKLKPLAIETNSLYRLLTEKKKLIDYTPPVTLKSSSFLIESLNVNSINFYNQ